MNEKLIWSNCLNVIKSELASLAFETWFNNTELYELKDNKATIVVPMEVQKKHLIENYSQLIKDTLKDFLNTDYELEFILDSDINNYQQEIVEKSTTYDFINNNVDKNIKSNLNKNYSFDTFIVGNSNRFAHAAALSVAENPGKMYNPLFIYGNSGLGKTHLMHAIGNYIAENTNKKVLYVTSEQFITDYTGIRNNDSNGYVDVFKDKYRNIDVLIIDDIQFLGGASKTQEEFFHTFNTLYGDNKQIIISSDKSPDDLKLLEDRLKTRFGWGLTVDIFPPDFELRVAILKKKIASGPIEKSIPEDVIEYIASNVGNDVRNLEGTITRLVAYSAIMSGCEITLDLAIECLKDYVNKGISEKNDIYKIQRIVAEHFQVTVDDLKSKKRSANLTFPRQIAMYLCRKLTNESLPKIGAEFGGKDHTTVMHSIDKIEKEKKQNKELENVIEKIKNNINVNN